MQALGLRIYHGTSNTTGGTSTNTANSKAYITTQKKTGTPLPKAYIRTLRITYPRKQCATYPANTQNIQEKFPVSKLPPSCHGTVWSVVSGSYFLISNFPSWNDFPKILFTMGELIFWKSLTRLEGSNFSKTNLTSPRVGHRKWNLVEKSTWSQLFQVNFSCIFWV